MTVSFFDDVRTFYRTHRAGLLSYARSLVEEPSDAEDLVQAAIFRLLKRGRAPRDLRSYLFRCLRNAAIDLHRRNGRRSIHGDAREIMSTEETQIAATDLKSCLAGLPPGDREIVILKAGADLTFREIAAVVGKNENTVASRYRRALAWLRRSLGEDA